MHKSSKPQVISWLTDLGKTHSTANKTVLKKSAISRSQYGYRTFKKKKKNEVVVVVVAFFSLALIWEECSTIHYPPALFYVDISSCTLIPLFMPGAVHSGSAS